MSEPRRIVQKWLDLPRRRCDNCGKMYKPGRPLLPTEKYGFHAPECKKQFHKHGSAFIKLKAAMEKEMARQGKIFTAAVQGVLDDLSDRIVVLEAEARARVSDEG